MTFTTLRNFSSKIAVLGGFSNKRAHIRPPIIISNTRFRSSLFLRQYSSKKYTKEHEWVDVDDDGVGTVGITDYAQTALGDVVFVEILEQGNVDKSDNIGAVESVKAASDIYAPVSGEIIESNSKLADKPSLINSSPENDGWLCKIKLSNPEQLEELLDKQNYDEWCTSESH
ncbi:glycine cleavage system H protein [Rhizophagus clarus]|uniref:Glycine cleavage system H protein n=1 Tax=Rhizophagus clarus TaxID=94130 RepID=A0A8H3KY33_9GLOM|nr:glycine cleavage system H protein [Rhizophagus clarus]